MTPAPNALDRLRSRLTPGLTVTCVENTYQPRRDGASNVLATVGKSYADATDGWRVNLPTRVRDVEWIDEDTVRWPLPTRDEHTVTYRLETPGGAR